MHTSAGTVGTCTWYRSCSQRPFPERDRALMWNTCPSTRRWGVWLHVDKLLCTRRFVLSLYKCPRPHPRSTFWHQVLPWPHPHSLHRAPETHADHPYSQHPPPRCPRRAHRRRKLLAAATAIRAIRSALATASLTTAPLPPPPTSPAAALTPAPPPSPPPPRGRAAAVRAAHSPLWRCVERSAHFGAQLQPTGGPPPCWPRPMRAAETQSRHTAQCAVCRDLVWRHVVAAKRREACLQLVTSRMWTFIILSWPHSASSCCRQ